jgi:hypothetical protein
MRSCISPDRGTPRDAGNWDRFSWFGFRRVLKGKDDDGLQKLGKMPTAKSSVLGV